MYSCFAPQNRFQGACLGDVQRKASKALGSACLAVKVPLGYAFSFLRMLDKPLNVAYVDGGTKLGCFGICLFCDERLKNTTSSLN